MELLEVWSFCAPLACIAAIFLLVLWPRFSRKSRGKSQRARRKWRLGAGAAMAGASFQYLAVVYRPSHAFLVKAQICQVENADEDDQGEPATPLESLHRQLRRIRHGECVESLVWRLE